MADGEWSQAVRQILEAEDPWSEAREHPEILQGAEVAVIAHVEAGTPLGSLLDLATAIDRSFRLATRSAETGEPIAMLRERGGRPIPVSQGLQVADVEPGSLRLLSDPSLRIRQALDSNGLRVVLAFCSIIGGTTATVELIEGDDQPTPIAVAPTPIRITVPTKHGMATASAPGTAEVVFRKNGQEVVVRVQP